MNMTCCALMERDLFEVNTCATTPSITDLLYTHRLARQDAPAPGSLDTVLCLSVTKWVHLHRGDAGLAALLARVAAALAPGGLLVLEPQPWRSYHAAVSKLRRAARTLPLLCVQGPQRIPLQNPSHKLSCSVVSCFLM